jgi:hypothetical protein
MGRASGITGRQLERSRLEDRSRRLTTVLTLLEERRDYRRSRDASVPPALSDAIGGFEMELLALDARLHELPPSAR